MKRACILISLILLNACNPRYIPNGVASAPTAPVVTPTDAPTRAPVLPSATTRITPVPPSETPSPAPTLTPVPPRATNTVPSISPTPRVINTPALAVRTSETSVAFEVYPYQDFQRDAHDDYYNWNFQAFDRDAFDSAASALARATVQYRAVVLENEYLRLTFLPDLGGRLFQLTYKPTNQNLFYNNRVLKPTRWGPDNQGGWLAVGGMEWALPVNEHGYEWGVPWNYKIAGNTITLWDTDATDRVRARISVTLPPHAAYVVVHPRVENPTSKLVGLQFWLNAQLALGSRQVSPNTRFSLPGDRVLVHSRGDEGLPQPEQPMSWPLYDGRDYSLYQTWNDYLGVFVEQPSRDFSGAYNPDTQLGLARVFPPEHAPGVKLFAFGANFCCKGVFADDGSDYFELWGGLPRTFFKDDDVTLAPGETREWEEYWLPFAQTGGLTRATREAVLFLDPARVSVSVSEPRAGAVVLIRDGAEVERWRVNLKPGAPFTAKVVGAGEHLILKLVAEDGTLLAATE